MRVSRLNPSIRAEVFLKTQIDAASASIWCIGIGSSGSVVEDAVAMTTFDDGR